MADNYGIGAFNTFDFISNKTCYKACGYTDDDMSRPIIGIANSYNCLLYTSFPFWRRGPLRFLNGRHPAPLCRQLKR